MKVLSLSDKIVDFIYSPGLSKRFTEVDMVLGCGDLPYYYLEYVLDQLEVPVFFVRGNHASPVEYGQHGQRTHPWGAVDLHRKLVHHEGVLLAGFEGSLRYRRGPFMYTQGEMWFFVLAMVPRLMWNWLVHGRPLDVLVTHAPPWGIHDQKDIAHQGFKAFTWLLRVFRPRYHFHGHIHIYDPGPAPSTRVGRTQVINTYGHRESNLELGGGD